MRRRGVLITSPDGSCGLRITAEADQNPVDEPRATNRVRRCNDPALIQRIVAAHNAGHNQAYIATALHVHVQTLRRHLQRAGVPTRRAALINNQLTEARQRKADGWTLRQLAHEYGVAHTTIGRLLSDPSL